MAAGRVVHNRVVLHSWVPHHVVMNNVGRSIRTQTMKGKRYSTEDKVRILREADSGKSIMEICREKNLSDVTFHRWRKQFGQMGLNEARRLKDLERENTELKKLLAEALLAKRVLEYALEKIMSPGAQKADGDGRRAGRAVLRAGCRVLRRSRASFWYQAGRRNDRQQQMVARLHALSDAHPRYGYRRIAALLRQEGWRAGKR